MWPFKKKESPMVLRKTDYRIYYSLNPHHDWEGNYAATSTPVFLIQRWYEDQWIDHGQATSEEKAKELLAFVQRNEKQEC